MLMFQINVQCTITPIITASFGLEELCKTNIVVTFQKKFNYLGWLCTLHSGAQAKPIAHTQLGRALLSNNTPPLPTTSISQGLKRQFKAILAKKKFSKMLTGTFKTNLMTERW